MKRRRREGEDAIEDEAKKRRRGIERD